MKSLRLAGVLVAAAAIALAALAVPSQAVRPKLPWPPSTWTDASGADEITFYYGLKRRDNKAVHKLRRISDPSGLRYRQFLDVDVLATRFGATAAAQKAVSTSAEAAGLTYALDRSAVFARVSGTVAAMEHWLAAEVQTTVVDGVRVYRAKGTGVPHGLSRSIRESAAIYLTQEPGARLSSQPYLRRGSTGTWVGGCEEARTDAYSYQQLQHAYGRLAEPDNRRLGNRVHLAILSAGSGFSDEALAASAACFNTQGRDFTRVPVDGLSEPLPEGGEGSLDTQISQSALPRGSQVSVVEQLAAQQYGVPLWFLLWAKVLELPDLPDAATLSYSVCERGIRQFAGAQAFPLWDAVFVRLGLAGVSMMSSSGDDGSSACADAYEDDAALSVGYPASSPYVTGVGGSQIALRPNNTRRSEVVWNSAGAGGGGKSRVYDRPWYQRRAVTGGQVRSVPDLSLHASDAPAAWPLYLQGEGPDSESGWEPVWGTSAATPFFASNVAIMAGKQATKGESGFGLLNPGLYQADVDRPRAFFDIVRTNNTTLNKKCCQAHPGYDRASGLGAPNLRILYRGLVSPGVPGRG